MDKLQGQTKNNYQNGKILEVDINQEGGDVIFFRTLFELEGFQYDILYNINKKTFKAALEEEISRGPA